MARAAQQLERFDNVLLLPSTSRSHVPYLQQVCDETFPAYLEEKDVGFSLSLSSITIQDHREQMFVQTRQILDKPHEPVACQSQEKTKRAEYQLRSMKDLKSLLINGDT
jgi:hypothetical protein